MTAPRTTCPDCSMELQPIQFIIERGLGAKPLTYAAADAKGSRFWGEIPALGTVKGSICAECGRIILHGEKASAT